MAVKNKTKKKHKACPEAIIHIQASFNNTIVSITDKGGNLLVASSSGKVGFKNSRKSTPYASQCAMNDALKRAVSDHGVKRASVFIKGPGFGRESALRSLISAECEITSITDRTPIPHNGCRPPKKRKL